MKILFGIFDWGLGHATRDIPLITELLKSNEVHIITTGGALKILKGHFKDKCAYHDVPSLYPPYTRTPFFKLKFALSSPVMVKNLRTARKKTQKIVARGFDKVISDCRYDVFDKPSNSYLINHQLRFRAPYGAERVAEKWLASKMKKYKYVIVPDFEDDSLSGKLSHDLRYVNGDKVKYIGILSRLKKKSVSQDIDYFISLSGPEPQRSILEKKVLSQVDQLKGKVVIAGGNPHSNSNGKGRNFEFHSFLNARQQQDIMNRAKFIVSRSGYTTVMELAELGKKKVLLMPTPGQSEQVYLARYFERKNMFHRVSQYRLKLRRDILACRRYEGYEPPWKTNESVKKFCETVFS
jgi:uncharacterized protein (TIGR00661 family)